MKLHKDLDCYPQVWQDVATAYYVSSATSLRAQDAHAQQNSIAQRASFGNALETRVELTRSAPRLPGPLSPQQRPPCFGMVAAKKNGAQCAECIKLSFKPGKLPVDFVSRRRRECAGLNISHITYLQVGRGCYQVFFHFMR